MRLKLGLGLAAICVVPFAVPAWAHHSHGNYLDTFMDIEGVVKEVHLLAPHSWVYLEVLEVKDAKGETQMWALEATGRTGLQKIGVTGDYIKYGDKVKARCHRLRDGSNGCLLGFLKARDGSVKDWDGNNATPPTDF